MNIQTPRREWPAEGLTRVPYWIYSDSELYAEEQERIFGDDPWEYGLTDRNRRTLETYLGYSLEQGLTRRLFSPSFVAWMAEGLPEAYAFELADSTLVVYAGGHLESAPELDRLAAATGTIAKRLRDEIAETTSKP